MRVLSLFDGMSCGMIALKRAGFKVDKYFSSEIDKHAIEVSKQHYPSIVRLGDVNNWRNWKLGEIDLIIGGSPCQGFSFAGKQLAFDDPRSRLFFTMMEIIEHYKPKYFLLENVKMKKEHIKVINDYTGVQPIEINSALVSAQNRKRLYWTNIPGVQQPKDKNILIEDIIEDGLVDKRLYIPFDKLKKLVKKKESLSSIKEGVYGLQLSNSSSFGNYWGIKKGYTLVTGCPNGVLIAKKPNLQARLLTPIEAERMQTVPDNYTFCVPKHARYHMLGNGRTVDVIAHIFSYIDKK